jgi:hypothetical protein
MDIIRWPQSSTVRMARLSCIKRAALTFGRIAGPGYFAKI